MKLHVAGLVAVMLGAFVLGGCGPGLGHHGKWAKAPGDMASTTTIMSESMPLPASRMPVFASNIDPWEDDDADDTLQTWGAPPKPEDKYGF